MDIIKRICNGKIVTPNEIIENGTIVIEGNTIVNIERNKISPVDLNDIDAAGMWVFPGLIDSHSDAIEQEIQPRPTSVMPVSSAFYELERKLAGQGITTMYHSLSLNYTESNGNWVRRNHNVEAIIKKILELTKEQSLIRNKIHLRYELRNIEGYPVVEELLKRNLIDQVSFMDHTPGKGQWHDIEIQKKKFMKQLNLTSEEADLHILELQHDTNLNFDAIKDLADLAYQMGIPLASHDDDTIEKIKMLETWKAAISEFPISLEIAEEARRRGFYVVVGAPNLLLGGSHNKNLSSFEAIQAGLVDILCSDYYPGSLLHGIFYLYNRGHDLVDAVKLATLNPAKSLGLADFTGSIEIGKRADILIIDDEKNQPKLHKTILDGEVIYQIQYRNLEKSIVK
ncbi:MULTISPECIES: alpha-D-ribose 1-methylphosphonate 5-triphosphate diphosphatase [Bacillus]|uniref:Amidohydrolase-related domain-containing protein n=2 Tax=Bacillus TaxID=1386 RepID=A0A0M4FLT7_9BACI|nr:MULTISPECIES: alpha-D-ribose 1-methylphosphonate 5-triphosphate diphosphatase [Bacillus]ALC83104.1 hypothetical protein AM592_17135 [Bacillus gobiensis]MBP1082159.1 alpha-D-ribose 1-methylphosphonate 5-triphosphate diphosphatase [Bacillus capparidis]MED1096773.1 alpha-D-ribose 1-methylphosphonate 5-triphosphate diphosphatase [Bacillus capparidis]